MESERTRRGIRLIHQPSWLFWVAEEDTSWLTEHGAFLTQSETSDRTRRSIDRVSRRENEWLDEGPGGARVFIKRILKTRARDLLERWKLGGPLTQSSPVYEFHMLCLAQERGIRVPTPVAAGERRSIGFAREGFLVVKALTGISLLELLQQNAARDGNKKRRIAHYVGAAVARLHAAGLSFPSLFSKHVYFDSQCEEPIGFLDLADATDHGKLPPPRLRYEDLSALGATLPRSDVNHGLRLLALRSYLKELGRAESEWRNMWNRIAGGVKSQAKRKRHRLFSSRHPVPLPIVHQNADGSEVRHEALPLIAAFASNVYPTDEGARLPAGFESKRERRSVAMKHWRTLYRHF
jgi:hypothetical protein